MKAHFTASAGVGLVQLVAEPDIVDEGRRPQLDINIANDAAIALPTRIHAQFNFISPSSCRVRNKICNGYFQAVVSFPGLSSEIEFIGNIGSHRPQLGAVDESSPMVGDRIEMKNGSLVR